MIDKVNILGGLSGIIDTVRWNNINYDYKSELLRSGSAVFVEGKKRYIITTDPVPDISPYFSTHMVTKQDSSRLAEIVDTVLYMNRFGTNEEITEFLISKYVLIGAITIDYLLSKVSEARERGTYSHIKRTSNIILLPHIKYKKSDITKMESSSLGLAKSIAIDKKVTDALRDLVILHPKCKITYQDIITYDTTIKEAAIRSYLGPGVKRALNEIAENSVMTTKVLGKFKQYLSVRATGRGVLSSAEEVTKSSHERKLFSKLEKDSDFVSSLSL